jgi:hypothetical protein
MNVSQLRIQLVVAAGIIGTALLGATFTGCNSNSTNSPYGGGPLGQTGGGPNGQPYGAFSQQPQQPQQGGFAGGGPNTWTPQNQQAFVAETQRLGGQPNLNAQDVIAMKQSGVPDQQIAMAIQQRGANLRSTPGMPQYLSQNGVNPAVLGGTGQFAQPGMAAPAGNPYSNQVAMNGAPAGFAQHGNAAAMTPPMNPFENPGMPAGYQPSQPMPGNAQTAGFESSAAPPGFDTPGSAANGMAAGQSWRPMAH